MIKTPINEDTGSALNVERAKLAEPENLNNEALSATTGDFIAAVESTNTRRSPFWDAPKTA